MRLIDADNAIHALGVFSDMEHGNKHFLNGINSAKEIINECVTIDAVPVVRGEWITTETYSSMYRTNLSETTCSACGKRPNIYMLKSDYCPNCGCKMEDKPCG